MTVVKWEISDRPIEYNDAVFFMEQRVEAIRSGHAEEMVWLVEHPPLYTAGSSAKASDLLTPGRFPVYTPGRGGQYTYHGPGQRIAYVMLDLKRHAGPSGPDLREYVFMLEAWLIATLAAFGVTGERREGRIGIWVRRGNREDKVAALGIRVRKWVSYHGVALNVAPNLEHFSGIVPCGIKEYGVTSLADLGIKTSMAEVDSVLKREFGRIFRDAL